MDYLNAYMWLLIGLAGLIVLYFVFLIASCLIHNYQIEQRRKKKAKEWLKNEMKFRSWLNENKHT